LAKRVYLFQDLLQLSNLLAAGMFKVKTVSLKSGFGYKFLSKIWLLVAKVTAGQTMGAKRLFGVSALIL
jgi:hypothetical protein